MLPFLCAAPLSHVISISSRLSNLCKYDSIYIRFCENKNDANSWVINDREWKKKKMKLNARFCKDFSAEQFVQWFEIECGVIGLLLSALLGLPQNDTSMKKIYLLFDSQLDGDTLRSSAKWFQFKINGESIKSTQKKPKSMPLAVVFLRMPTIIILHACIWNKCTSIFIVNYLQSFIFTAFHVRLISVLSWVVAFCLLAKNWHHNAMQCNATTHHTTHISQWDTYCN